MFVSNGGFKKLLIHREGRKMSGTYTLRRWWCWISNERWFPSIPNFFNGCTSRDSRHNKWGVLRNQRWLICIDFISLCICYPEIKISSFAQFLLKNNWFFQIRYWDMKTIKSNGIIIKGWFEFVVNRHFLFRLVLTLKNVMYFKSEAGEE